MANKERNVNININYKVNDQDLSKGAATADRANQATNQLQQSTQKFNTSAAQGYRSTSKYIEGMEVELAKLRQQIKLTSTEDTARITKLSSQYKALKQQVDAYNKSLFETSAATKQASVSSQDLARNFGQVVTAVKVFIAAGLVREVVDMSLNMAKLSGNVAGVERAFKRAFPGGESVLIDLRKATHGAVSDFELMQRTLQATNLGVNVDHLGVLFEFAATRAQQTGESVDYLVDSIVRGIGRKSVLVLDNLGLSATRLKQEFDGVAIASKSVGEVTEGVARIAKVELEKMGGFTETTATQVDQLTVSWKELREEIAKAATEGPAGGTQTFLKDYVDSFKALIESFNRGIPVSEVFAEKQRQQLAVMSANEFVNRRFTKDRKENIKIIEEEITALTKEIGSWTTFRDIMDENIISLKEEKGERATRDTYIDQQIASAERLRDANKGEALLNQELLRLLQAKLLALKQINKEVPPVEDQGPRAMPAELKQVVDLDLRDPVTGEIGKFDKDNIIKAFDSMVQLINQLQHLPSIKVPVELSPDIRFMDSMDMLGLEFAENWKGIVSSGLMDTTDIINATIQKEADSYDVRLAQLKAFYDEQLALTGETEEGKTAFEVATHRRRMELELERDREEQKLRRKAFEADKEAKRLQTIINGAAGIINAFATLPYPAAIVAGIQITGATLAQLSVINKQQYKGFKDGVIDLDGPGTTKSDSIHARLSKHESVMTAEETASSKGIFQAVRAKKLNDRVLKEIMSGRSGGATASVFDDSRIIKKLDEVKNSQPDFQEVGNMMMRTRQKSENYRQWIRCRSLTK